MHSEHILFHQAEKHFFSLVSFYQKDYGNMLSFATGDLSYGLNPVFLKQVDRQFQDSLLACQSYYETAHFPWSLVVPDYLMTSHLEHELKSLGFSCVGKGVAMRIAIDGIQFPSHNLPLQCKIMHHDVLDSWGIPLTYGFESTPEDTAVYVQRHRIASQNKNVIYHFSGFFDNAPVCSLTLSIHENQARIDDVATMPACQKQGFATALIYEALRYAKLLNISTCFLEASRVGLKLYQRIGFKELFQSHYYSKG